MANTSASDPSNDSPELAALKQRASLLEQRVAIVEREKKLVDAATPDLPAGLKGTITLEGDPIQNRMLAYRELRRAARQIGSRVRRAEPAPTRVIIHDPAVIASLTAYTAIAASLESALSALDREVQQGHAALNQVRSFLGGAEVASAVIRLLPAIAGAAIKTVTGFISLLRDDISVKNKELTIADSALVAAVCGDLARVEGVRVYNPALAPAVLPGTSSTLLAALARLSQLRVNLDAVLGEIEAERMGASAAEAAAKAAAGKNAGAESTATDPPPSDSGPTLSDRLAEVERRLKLVAASADQLQAGLSKADAATGATPLMALLRAEALAPLAAGSHLLSLRVASACGASETHQPGAFKREGKQRYSGGVVVEFMLCDPTGLVADAGALSLYSGFVEVIEGDHPVDLIEDEL